MSMHPGSRTNNLLISLLNDEEGDEKIQLIAPGEPVAVYHLSVQQARMLATTLILHVHRAEVSNSLRTQPSR